jgi:hypothetical protein
LRTRVRVLYACDVQRGRPGIQWLGHTTGLALARSDVATVVRLLSML